MIILGAKGHALEIVDVLLDHDNRIEIILYDNLKPTTDISSFKNFQILHTEEQLKAAFLSTKNFVLGVGDSTLRLRLTEIGNECGGELCSVISRRAYISKLDVSLGNGLNIMHGVCINPQVKIGNGTLINAGARIHHQSVVGEYCQIGPGAIITGSVEIGSHTLIGAGAIILPGLVVGEHVKIGAGAVVVKNVSSGSVVVGNPARKIK